MTRKDFQLSKYRKADSNPIPEDIIAPTMNNNDTWNTCPQCWTYWQSESIPGLLHRYIVCMNCKTEHDREKE